MAVNYVKNVPTAVVYQLVAQCLKRGRNGGEPYTLTASGGKNAITKFLDGRDEVESFTLTRHKWENTDGQWKLTSASGSARPSTDFYTQKDMAKDLVDLMISLAKEANDEGHY